MLDLSNYREYDINSDRLKRNELNGKTFIIINNDSGSVKINLERVGYGGNVFSIAVKSFDAIKFRLPQNLIDNDDNHKFTCTSSSSNVYMFREN